MNAYSDTRWVGLRLRFAFVDPDAASQAQALSSSQEPYSQIGQVLDEVEEANDKYATLEWNRWGLDDGYAIMPNSVSGIQTGWVCSTFSDKNGQFADPPFLAFEFTTKQSSVGFTITFDKTADERPSAFSITTLAQDGSTISYKRVENPGITAAVQLPSTDYYKVVFTFEKTPLPYHRVRVCEVLFGIIEVFDENSIAEGNLLYEIDPVAETLPSRKMDVKIDNSDRRFNLINPEGIYSYLQQPQGFTVTMGTGDSKDSIEYTSMGDFYFATAAADDSGLTAQISAYDWFFWMERGNYQNTATGTWTLTEAVTAILASAGISCDVKIESGKGSVLVNKNYTSMTHREALRLTVQAACCTAYFDRDGCLSILALSEESVVDTLNNDRMEESPKVSVNEAVNTVILSVPQIEGDELTFTASNKSDGELPQVKTITNSQVVAANGQTVANWLLNSLSSGLTYRTKERGNPETKLTDTIKIYDYYNVNRNAVVIMQDFKYDGGLSAESKAVTM